MNPAAIGVMWFLTLATVCVLVVSPTYIWIPLGIAGVYCVYAMIPSRR